MIQTDYTASISATFYNGITPLINGSWHYLGIVVAIAAAFVIFYFALRKFLAFFTLEHWVHVAGKTAGKATEDLLFGYMHAIAEDKKYKLKNGGYNKKGLDKINDYWSEIGKG